MRLVDRLALLIYNIQLEPILPRLEDSLPGVAFPDFEERVETHVDDVVGEDNNDLLVINEICRQFEGMSGPS